MNTPRKPVAKKPTAPVATFLLGVADDGLAEIRVEPPNFAISHTLLGSLNHYEQVKIPGMEKQALILVGNQHQRLRFHTPSIIVNCIVDADAASKALDQAQKFIDRLASQHNIRVPVINPPAGIMRTRRNDIYDSFHHLPALYLPRTIRITPSSVADAAGQIKAAGIRLPFIIRSSGSHGGKDMQKIDDFSPESLLKFERYAYDGRAFYITEWSDFKNRDGLYRKYRLVMVNGEMIARHMIVSDEWMIHSRSREKLMKTSAALRQEEEDYLNAPEKVISPEAISSLHKIRESLGLDYFGMDCSVNDDGTLTVFEINAAFNAMTQSGLDTYPYLAKPMKQVIQAFNDMVAYRSSFRKAA